MNNVSIFSPGRNGTPRRCTLDLAKLNQPSVKSWGGCASSDGLHLLDGAGHWVQQEQPEQVNKLLIAFLEDQRRAGAKP